MDTRSSDNWQKKPGGWDALQTELLTFEGDYPILDCKPFDFTNIVNCNNKRGFNSGSLVSTFLDDYHLERFWNRPVHYINRWQSVSGIMSPDFSLLIDMPDPMQRWQVYRNRLVGYVWQSAGINVVPTICWSDEKSFEYCFNGIAKNSMVAVSSIGMVSEWQIPYFQSGFDKMIDVIEPCKILFMANNKYRHLFNDSRIQWLDSFFESRRKSWEKDREKELKEKHFLDNPQGRNKQHNRLPNQQHRQNLNRVDR
jgi:hypothetical protein